MVHDPIAAIQQENNFGVHGVSQFHRMLDAMFDLPSWRNFGIVKLRKDFKHVCLQEKGAPLNPILLTTIADGLKSVFVPGQKKMLRPTR